MRNENLKNSPLDSIDDSRSANANSSICHGPDVGLPKTPRVQDPPQVNVAGINKLVNDTIAKYGSDVTHHGLAKRDSLIKYEDPDELSAHRRDNADQFLADLGRLVGHEHVPPDRGGAWYGSLTDPQLKTMEAFLKAIPQLDSARGGHKRDDTQFNAIQIARTVVRSVLPADVGSASCLIIAAAQAYGNTPQIRHASSPGQALGRSVREVGTIARWASFEWRVAAAVLAPITVSMAAAKIGYDVGRSFIKEDKSPNKLINLVVELSRLRKLTPQAQDACVTLMGQHRSPMDGSLPRESLRDLYAMLRKSCSSAADIERLHDELKKAFGDTNVVTALQTSYGS